MAVTLKGILQAVAPILADLLPGPLGGAVRKVVGEAIGKPDATEPEMLKALADATPEDLLKVTQAQNDFVLKWGQQGIDLEKMAADDRANARAMQIATRAKTPAVLASVAVVGSFGIIAFLLFREIPQTNRDIVVGAVGIVMGQLVTIYQFHFGTSSSSRVKDDTIKGLTNGK